MAEEVVEAIPLSKDAACRRQPGHARPRGPCLQSGRNRRGNRPGLLQPPTVRHYQVIGYYLKQDSELAGYFARRAREEQEILEAHQEEWSPHGLRERLLARRKNT